MRAWRGVRSGSGSRPSMYLISRRSRGRCTFQSSSDVTSVSDPAESSAATLFKCSIMRSCRLAGVSCRASAGSARNNRIAASLVVIVKALVEMKAFGGRMWPLLPGQSDSDLGPPARFAGQLDRPAVGLHDLPAQRESQAGAGGLGGDERPE